MRHGKAFNHLGRKVGHRKALMRNLTIALVEHKRINTTIAKAKALRKFVEPLVTKSKNNTTHSRRVVFNYLQNKYAVNELFETISPKIGDRPGGYLRIIKTGFRKSDGAEMAMIEFVDFNELLLNLTKKESSKSTNKTRRTRRGNKKTSSEAVVATTTSSTDDLKKIEGIGPKIAELLNNAGINTFSDLAATNAENVKSILTEAGSKFASHDPTTWADQAKMAADGEWDKLKKWQDELDGGKIV